MYEVTKEQFETWLTTKKDGEIVGECGNSEACIVANFLQETFHVPFSVSLGTYMCLSGDKKKIPYPEWMKKVIVQFDSIKQPQATRRSFEFRRGNFSL